MTTSQKHKNFLSEPIGERSSKDIAGIGEVLGKRLADQGYGQASKVLGQFLVLEQDEKRFTKWLESTVEANSKQARDCYKCLAKWCEQFL